jgi:hypothetical protein
VGAIPALSAVVHVAKPADPAAMNDDYQDAPIVAEDADSYTVEVVYYPLNDNRSALAAHTTPAFSLWFVDVTGETPVVTPELRARFDEEKRGPSVSDEDLFSSRSTRAPCTGGRRSPPRGAARAAMTLSGPARVAARRLVITPARGS